MSRSSREERRPAALFLSVMWWWVALGIVGVELLVLVLLALSVLLRLVDLARAAGRTRPPLAGKG